MKYVAALVAAATLSLAAAVPAHADPDVEGVEQAPLKNPAGPFCVHHLQPQIGLSAPQPLRSVSKPKRVCYQSATEAIKDATGGAITDIPADGKGLGSPEFVARIKAHNASVERMRAASSDASTAASAASYVIGAIFQLEWYEGQSDYFSAPSWCDNGAAFSVDMYGQWWDNRTSSVQMYGNCGAILYQFPGFQGDTYSVGTGFYEPYLGDFDNRTSSMWMF
ncbi:hypothetical protein [Microbispora hainanensis]|uniref:Peptidase inhibitor family I36 protein n=1 Tax=Microbispora hainanensis TaxID=568844 RepID=A0A544XJV3_9ACTN|nr:hypothetical protein [Microbispora hainanensis]TQS04763.1 hypothetical protein FLX08_39810 [Microbispora hainanensis]